MSPERKPGISQAQKRERELPMVSLQRQIEFGTSKKRQGVQYG